MQDVAALIAAVQHTTMFLLQRRGPTSFVVKDVTSGLKSVVQIGSVQSCTCQSKLPTAARVAPCAHVVFVMTKVLRIPSQHPMLWQASLTGAQLNPFMFWIARARCHIGVVRCCMRNEAQMSHVVQLRSCLAT